MKNHHRKRWIETVWIERFGENETINDFTGYKVTGCKIDKSWQKVYSKIDMKTKNITFNILLINENRLRTISDRKLKQKTELCHKHAAVKRQNLNEIRAFKKTLEFHIKKQLFNHSFWMFCAEACGCSKPRQNCARIANK